MRRVFRHHNEIALGHRARYAVFDSRSRQVRGIRARFVCQFPARDHSRSALDYVEHFSLFFMHRRRRQRSAVFQIHPVGRQFQQAL